MEAWVCVHPSTTVIPRSCTLPLLLSLTVGYACFYFDRWEVLLHVASGLTWLIRTVNLVIFVVDLISVISVVDPRYLN